VISLLLRTKGPVLTLREPHHAPKRGALLGDLNILFGANIGIDAVSGKVNYVSPQEPSPNLMNPSCAVIDCGERVVMPGFVDCHNHLLWAGSRAHEFFARCHGATYQEIAQAGGGILYTREKTLEATEDELVATGRRHLRLLVDNGVTTVEAKSGYALTPEGELTVLRAVARLQREFAGTIIPTYLGAHAIPPEFADKREEYVQQVIDTLPRVRAEKLAEFCDVFVDPLAFTVDEGRRILTAAKELGFQLKLHADEFGDDGGTALGLELGAVSVDHLAGIGNGSIAPLGDTMTVAVLLPATMFFTNTPMQAPARKMIDAGVAIALATDLNPGSSLVFSPAFVMTLACLQMQMGCDEVINAHVKNAAFALGRGYTKGALAPGMDADVVVLDTDDYRELGYYIGGDNIDTVIARGRILKRGGKLGDSLMGESAVS
jgi:imidazolonepropionase